MSSVFISYRRTDSEGYAGRIFDRLHQEFGNQVFRDVDTIDGGTRFPDEIDKQLGICKVVLVVIGPNWLDVRDESGKRRLEDPQDWVRIEVSTALPHNVCVIPVTVGGAQLPAAKDLPKPQPPARVSSQPVLVLPPPGPDQREPTPAPRAESNGTWTSTSKSSR